MNSKFSIPHEALPLNFLSELVHVSLDKSLTERVNRDLPKTKSRMIYASLTDNLFVLVAVGPRRFFTSEILSLAFRLIDIAQSLTFPPAKFRR